MNYKVLGAAMIICSSGMFGLSLAASGRRETQILRQIEYMTNLMESELSSRLTPLPELCRKVGKSAGGMTRRVLELLAEELDNQIAPDASSCMHCVLAKMDALPRSAQRIFAFLGATLGEYDLEGQLKGLTTVRHDCTRMLQRLEQDQEKRLRGYGTLGLCVGAALVILFI